MGLNMSRLLLHIYVRKYGRNGCKGCGNDGGMGSSDFPWVPIPTVRWLDGVQIGFKHPDISSEVPSYSRFPILLGWEQMGTEGKVWARTPPRPSCSANHLGNVRWLRSGWECQDIVFASCLMVM